MLSHFLTGVSAVCAIAPSTANSDTVARALGSFTNQIGIWGLDENGNWTQERRLMFESNIGNGWYHASHVYVPQFVSNTSTNYVYIYSTSGSRLATLPVLVDTDGSNGKAHVQEVCVTPDGQYLFATMGETKNVWRYDLSQGTSSGAWEKFATLGNTCLRGIVPDEAGHVFVAGRNDHKIFCYDWTTGECKWSYLLSGINVTGLAYNPADDYLYWVGHDGNYGRLRPDSSDPEEYQADSSDTLMYPGWAYGLCIANGKPYVNFYNASSNLRITEISSWPDTFRNAGTPPSNKGNGLALMRETPDACWRFNDGTNSAVIADKYGAFGAILPQAGLRTGATEVPEYGVAVGSAYFSGAYSRAVLSDSNGFIPTTNDFTVSFWFGLPAVAEWSGAPRIIFSNDCRQDGALSVTVDPDSSHLNVLGLSFAQAGKEELSIVTSATVADGAWHHVALARRGGTSIELWLDGALAGSATCSATDSVAQDADWHFGCSADERRGFVGADAFIGEVRYFSSAVDQNEIYWAARERNYASPTCPSAPEQTAALPSGFGTEIARATAGDAPFGAPSVLVASDGSYWVAADRAYGGNAADNVTTFWRSTDNGATWVQYGTLAAGGVSLFDANGTVCAFGTECGSAQSFTATVFAIWKYSAGAWTRAAACSTNTCAISTSPGVVVGADGRVGKPFAASGKAFAGSSAIGWVSFPVDGADFGDGLITYPQTIENPTYANSSTIRAVVPGNAVADVGGTSVFTISPMSEADTADGIRGADRAYVSSYSVSNGTMTRNDSEFIPFRCGGGMFGIAYDGREGAYRTLSAVNGALEMQFTTNFWAWQPCGTVAAAQESGKYTSPAIAIVENDMIVVTGVQVGNAASGDAATHLAFRRVANFRTVFTPEDIARRRILVTNFQKGHVQSFWQAGDGNWYSAGFFLKNRTAMGSRNTRQMSSIVCGENRVWAAEGARASGAGILELREDGRYRRWLDNAPVDSYFGNLACDSAGHYLFGYFDATNAIWKCNLSTGAWTEFKSGDMSAWDNPAHFAVASDGSLYTAGYGALDGNYRVCHYNADGSLDRVVFSIGRGESGNDAFTGIALDEERKRLFVSTCYGRIRKLDLENGDACTELYNIGLKYNQTCGQLMYLDGVLYGTGHPGWIFTVNPDTGAFSVPFGRIYAAFGIAAVGVTPEHGFVITFH